MKTKRQNEIIRLITSGDIETQEELASELRALGYKVTQATVSRDIRELRLIKVAAKDGGFNLYFKPYFVKKVLRLIIKLYILLLESKK